jgi:hypothetical protein
MFLLWVRNPFLVLASPSDTIYKIQKIKHYW